MNFTWYDYLLTLSVGTALTAAGIIQKRKRVRLLNKGIKAEGLVLELIVADTRRPGNSYFPVIRFVTLEKEWITQQYNISGSSYHEGDSLTVIYDPGNPRDFIINDKSTRSLEPLFIIIGTAILLFDLVLMILSLFPQIKIPYIQP